MSDPIQDYRDAVAKLLAAGNRTIAAEMELRDAQEAEQEARIAKKKAETAMHRSILKPQQLQLGVTQQ